MQNQNFISKETTFNNLPADVKNKLIELRNISQDKFTFAKTHPLKEVGNVSIPSCDKLHKQFCELVKISEDLKMEVSVEENFVQNNKEFTQFVNYYKNNINNHNIVDEFEKTISLLDERYKELSKKYTFI